MMGSTSEKNSTDPAPPLHTAALRPLELGKALLAVPDIRQIPSMIAAVLQQVIPHDYAAIALRDDGRTDQLRVRKLTSGVESGSMHDGYIPIERTPAGWVYANHEPLQMSKMDAEDFYRSTHPVRLLDPVDAAG
jgi:hypothetical protein